MSQMYLKVNGQYAAEDMMEAVAEIMVDTSMHLPNMFTIRLQDPNFEWMDSPLLEIGKLVAISGKAWLLATPLRINPTEKVTDGQPDRHDRLVSNSGTCAVMSATASSRPIIISPT